MKARMRTALLCSAAALLFLSGCKTTSQAIQEDPGPYPTNYEASIKQWMQFNLKDPSSVQGFSATEPKRGAAFFGMINGGAVSAWSSCAYFNAKNSFGGYVGQQGYVFYIKNGQVIHVLTMPVYNTNNVYSC